MKLKYGIGLFLIIIVVLYLSYSFVSGSMNEDTSENQHETTVTTDGEAKKEDCYYLYEVNGYIVVFLSDKKTPYEYTNILFDNLPEILQIEIKNGKYIKNPEELYGFLENYTS